MGNATEHATAVLVDIRNRMDLTIRITTGSRIQIAFLVTPSLVTFGWSVDKLTDLQYGGFRGYFYTISTLFVILSLTKSRRLNYQWELCDLCTYYAVVNLAVDVVSKIPRLINTLRLRVR